MYNFFKYQQTVRLQELQRKEEEKYSQWLLKNQDIKEQAKQKQRLKLQDWVSSQLKDGVKNHVQDPHYKQWRFLKQFRDVQNQPNFKGYKTFRHKPSLQMNKYFDERQRKEIAFLSNKKQSLVDSELIHEFQRSRSLRSQGPLNPKIQFRTKKKDHEYLNPRMRFHNVTDKERMNETTITFDDKFKSLYSSFQLKKSQIGKTKVNFYDDQNVKNVNRSRSTQARYNNEVQTQKSYHFKDSLNNQIRYQALSPQNQENMTQSKHISDSKISERMPEIQSNRQPSRKTYFKLAKTMQLQGNTKIKKLLLQSQYDRKKDLSNLRLNMTCQNYYKKPIL